MRKSLRIRIFIIVGLCWLIPTLVLGGALRYTLLAALFDQTEASIALNSIHAESLSIEALDRLIALSKATTYDNVLEAYAQDLSYGRISEQEYRRYSRVYLDQKFSRDERLTFGAYYALAGAGELLVSTGAAAAEEGAYFKEHVLADVLALSEGLDTRCHFSAHGGRLYLVRNLYSKRMERFGVLILGVLPEATLGSLSSLAREDWASKVEFWLDDYVSGTTEGFDGALGLSQEGNVFVYAGQWEDQDYRFSYRLHFDKTNAYAQYHYFNRALLILLLFLVPVEAALMAFVYRRFYKPLTALGNAAREMAAGTWGATAPVDQADEIGQLSKTFNAMSLQIQQLIEQSYEEALVLRDARIEAMQSRINPHFLNNALELINWQARLEGNDTVSGMIDALSILLNASIDRTNRRLIPLRDELTVADAYLYFLKQSFGERLTVERDIDPDLLDHNVPRLMTQPLLENAITHGIAPAGKGTIRLRVYRDAGDFVLEVGNDGKPLDEEKRLRIAMMLEETAAPTSDRLGVQNIHLRLRLLFGPGAGLSLGRTDTGETLARARIPLGSDPERQT